MLKTIREKLQQSIKIVKKNNMCVNAIAATLQIQQLGEPFLTI